MKDTKEIVLFMEDGATFTPIDVAKDLCDRYPELGDPLLLPNGKDKSMPLIIFNSNPDFQIQISSKSLNFVVNHSKFDDVSTIMFDCVDAFDNVKVKFNRVGMVANIFLAPQNIEKALYKFIKVENTPDLMDFNFSWYRTLENKYGTFNCWERIFTNATDGKDLLIQFDINSIADEKIDFNMKYIKEFVNTVNNVIDDRTNY